MKLVARGGIAAAAAAVTMVAGYQLPVWGTSPPALGPAPVTVVVEIDHSRFSVSSLRVVEGTTVRFVVINRDPINHELIVGPPEVHQRHRNGTESAHGTVAGEVSVRALDRGVTSYTFSDAGTVEMACHLAGHYEYGMQADVEVLAEGGGA